MITITVSPPAPTAGTVVTLTATGDFNHEMLDFVVHTPHGIVDVYSGVPSGAVVGSLPSVTAGAHTAELFGQRRSGRWHLLATHSFTVA